MFIETGNFHQSISLTHSFQNDHGTDQALQGPPAILLDLPHP